LEDAYGFSSLCGLLNKVSYSSLIVIDRPSY
jgi:hypothetical protein